MGIREFNNARTIYQQMCLFTLKLLDETVILRGGGEGSKSESHLGDFFKLQVPLEILISSQIPGKNHHQAYHCYDCIYAVLGGEKSRATATERNILISAVTDVMVTYALSVS